MEEGDGVNYIATWSIGLTVPMGDKGDKHDKGQERVAGSSRFSPPPANLS